MRHACRVNGIDALALTKLDVLDGRAEVQVCTAYRCRGTVVTDMPGDVAQLAACEPIYERLPGWTEPTRGIHRYDDLPAAAKSYIAYLEAITGVPAVILSTGSAREDTIFREGTLGAALPPPAGNP